VKGILTDRRNFIRTATGAAAAAVVAPGYRNLHAQQPREPPESHPNFPVNPFEREGRWFKAALHVHTTTSDGDVDVPTRIGQYREAGYDVVAITDHWKTNDLSGFSDETFLAICGMEAHPATGTGAPSHHFVCLGLPHPFELAKDMPAQALIDKAKAAGAKIIYAHPYWTAHSMEEMMEVSGYCGVEVFNAVCDLMASKGYNQVHWDQLLNKGRIVAGLATDDVHKSKDLDLGWTMVRAPALTQENILAAIESGCFYASCGPAVEDFRIENNTVRIRCSSSAVIRFFYNGSGGGRTFRAEPGQALSSAEWTFGGGKRSIQWIRAEVVDADGRHAWTNPLRAG